MVRFVKIVNTTRGVAVGTHVQVAATSLSRMIGLLGKRGLDPGQGLWIGPSSGVHTFGMRFAIDVVGLDRELRVVRLWANLAPHRMTGVSTKLRSVIELPAGQIVQAGVQLGDVLCVEEMAAA